MKVLKTKNTENLAQGHRQRIRQRFMEYGSDILHQYEKLELFLTMCIPRKDVKPIAKNLLNKFGSISAILNATDKELLEIKGIGEYVICNIKILRMCLEAQLGESIKKESVSLDSVELLAKYFERRLAHLSYEVVELLCLDSQLNMIGDSAIRICEGDVSKVNVDMRKIIEIAIKYSASNIVIAHNHPKGENKPSPEDINFTKVLFTTCDNLNIDFIEHIIIAKDKFFSFKRSGNLDILYDVSLKKKLNKKVASPKKILKDK